MVDNTVQSFSSTRLVTQDFQLIICQHLIQEFRSTWNRTLIQKMNFL